MPVAGYPNFDACVKGMVDKEHYDEETARKVCGKIESEKKKSADGLLNELKAEYGDDKRLFLGKLSVDIKDNQNDRISPEAFEKVMPTFMKRGVLIDTHSNKVVGKPLRYWMRDGNMGTEVVVGWQVYDDYSIDDEMWNNIRNGDYGGMSIGGMALPNKQNVVCGKDGCYLQIDGIELWEGSAVANPANKEATIMAVNELAKSDITVTPDNGLLTKNEVTMADNEINKTVTGTPSASEGDTVRKDDTTLAPPTDEAASNDTTGDNTSGNDVETKLEAVIELLQNLSSRMDAVEAIVAPDEQANAPEEEQPNPDENTGTAINAADIEKSVTATIEKAVPQVLAKALQQAGFVAAERPDMAGGKSLIKDDNPKALTLDQIKKMSFEELAQVEVA